MSITGVATRQLRKERYDAGAVPAPLVPPGLVLPGESGSPAPSAELDAPAPLPELDPPVPVDASGGFEPVLLGGGAAGGIVGRSFVAVVVVVPVGITGAAVGGGLVAVAAVLVGLVDGVV
jgi:hypothetical protein